MEESLLIEKHPVLYHMAEAGSWPSICELGLLSTRALLDHYQATDEDRTRFLSSHRESSTPYHSVIIRDQKPMNHNLKHCLQDGITPRQWYEFLNKKVFFSGGYCRLHNFQKAYGTKRQLIIELPTWKIVEAHRDEINLCHINSGATRMPNHYRSFATFQPISSFVWSSKHKVAELTVEFAVKDIAALASKVYETGGGQEEAVLYSA